MNWAGNLDTLILRNNLLTRFEARMFRNCPKLRELSISYNSFEHLDSESFRDVALSLESLEISFGLNSKFFPEQVKALSHLMQWSADSAVDYINAKIRNFLFFLQHATIHCRIRRPLRQV